MPKIGNLKTKSPKIRIKLYSADGVKVQDFEDALDVANDHEAADAFDTLVRLVRTINDPKPMSCAAALPR